MIFLNRMQEQLREGKVCSHLTNYPEEDFTIGCWAQIYKDKGRARCNLYSSSIDRLSDRFFARGWLQWFARLRDRRWWSGKCKCYPTIWGARWWHDWIYAQHQHYDFPPMKSSGLKCNWSDCTPTQHRAWSNWANCTTIEVVGCIRQWRFRSIEYVLSKWHLDAAQDRPAS